MANGSRPTVDAGEVEKRAAARAALAYVPTSGVVGLGTGSTARYFIEEIGQLVAQGRDLRAVVTSEQSKRQALALGISLLSDEDVWDIAVCVDGADEVSAEFDLIKGGGGAHTREKIVNHHSRKNVIVVGEDKLSRYLGEKWPVPLEVLPFGLASTLRVLAGLGVPTLREKSGKPVITDSGNRIVDLAVGAIERPREFDLALRSVPGVVETGLFCGRADVVLVGGPDGARVLTPGR
jgi:ribose 5-phosphate isomerase A